MMMTKRCCLCQKESHDLVNKEKGSRHLLANVYVHVYVCLSLSREL